MECNNIKKNTFKIFCLKRKLGKLQVKRSMEIASFILSCPNQASKMDNIEIESVKTIELKIKAINRLLRQYSNN